MLRLILVSCIWAFSFGINKQFVAGADPVLVTFIRLELAMLVMLPWLRMPKSGLNGAASLIGIGAVQFGLMYVALNYCFIFLQAYQVALFTVITPLYVAAIEAAKTKRRPKGLFAAAFLALAGAALVESWDVDRKTFWAAFLVMQVSNAAFAWGQVAYKDWRRAHPVEKDMNIFGWLYIGGTLVALLWAAFDGKWSEMMFYTPGRTGALLYLGLIASGIGFYLWNTGATVVNSGALAAMNNLKSPLAVLVSAVFWGSGLTPFGWIRLAAGMACIIAAVAVVKAEKS